MTRRKYGILFGLPNSTVIITREPGLCVDLETGEIKVDGFEYDEGNDNELILATIHLLNAINEIFAEDYQTTAKVLASFEPGRRLVELMAKFKPEQALASNSAGGSTD